MSLRALLRRVFTRNRYREYSLLILIYPRAKPGESIRFNYWCRSEKQLLKRAIEVFELEAYYIGRIHRVINKEGPAGTYAVMVFERILKSESI